MATFTKSVQQFPLLFGASGVGEHVEMKHISEVKRGKACGCRCPVCGATLIAHKGKRRMHHFTHFFVSECKGSAETALHLYAKQLIAKQKKVRLPTVQAFKHANPLTASKLYQAQKSILEQSVGKHVVDVLLQQENHSLAVELKVSHAVDPYKERSFIRSGQEAIEIDVSAIYQDLYERYQCVPTLEQLSSAILYSKKHRRWLFNRHQHNFEYKQRHSATPRKIKSVQRPDYHHHWVRNCPDPERRRIKRMDNYRLAYARLHQDCGRCPHCFEVEYQYEWVGYQRVPVQPACVLCTYPLRA
ncbi:MAG: hypothetical protein AAF828_05620 [Bacteroidota bacterium]